MSDVRDRFVIDPGVSRFTVRATAAGMLSALGHNPTFSVRGLSGEIVFDAHAPEAGSLRLTIQAASLDLQDDVSERDRREILRATQEDVLEVVHYPEIRFESVQVRRRDGAAGPLQLAVTGDVTLHGRTRRKTIGVRMVPMDTTLRANGEFVLRQSDYGIRPVTMAGSMLRVKDELNFAFDIVSRRRT